jgi:hypothetical protein
MTTFAIVPDGDGDPHEYAVEVPRMILGDSEPVILIGISAAGGGTVGESYANNGWAYTVLCDGEPVITGDDIRSGAMGATHAQMARTLCNFLSAAGESLYHSDDDSEYDDEYGDSAREFLISEYERLSSFGIES